MEKQGFFVSRDKLVYGISGQAVSNQFEEKYDAIEIPTVFYLNLKYEDEIYLPVSLFQTQLSPLQAIVKFLKENLEKTNKQIALLLNRDPKTIWITYRAVEKKKSFQLKESEIQIPLSIFKDRKLSVLEALVSFLKEQDLKYSEIASLLNRDQRTVWTVHTRAKKKLGKKIKHESRKK